MTGNLALLPAVCVLPVHGQDDFFSTIDVDIDSTDNSSSQVEMLGWVTQKIGQGLESPGTPFSRENRDLNRFETSIYLQLDARTGDDSSFRISGEAFHDAIYRLNDHTDYDVDERNEFRNRYEIRDFYYEQQLNNGLYFRLGNQILAWGMAEYLRVTDLINTEDQYTFAQQDLEDLRIQVPALLTSFNIGEWTLDGVVTYDAGRNWIAPKGDEFDQFIRFRDANIQFQRFDPAKDYEIFLRASTHYANGDVQLVIGEFNENALSVTQIEGLKSIRPTVSYSQNRVRAAGIAANWVSGSWLWFGELGLHRDKAMQPDKDSFLSTLNGWTQKDQVLSVLGTEYNGFRNITFTLEFDHVRTQDYVPGLLVDEDQFSYGARVYWTALNERLQILAVWNELADDTGQVTRISLDYDWTDNFQLGLLWVDYHAGSDSFLHDFRNNDVLQLQLRYSFQI